MLIGTIGDLPKEQRKLNRFTSNHFALAGKNQWTKIGIRECTLLLGRFYMNDYH
jgi:hypothetical protein